MRREARNFEKTIQHQLATIRSQAVEVARLRRVNGELLDRVADLERRQNLTAGTNPFVSDVEQALAETVGILARELRLQLTEKRRLRFSHTRLSRIRDQVLAQFGMSITHFMSSRRDKVLIDARKEFVRRAWLETGETITAIARYAGQNDHTAAIAWVQKLGLPDRSLDKTVSGVPALGEIVRAIAGDTAVGTEALAVSRLARSQYLESMGNSIQSAPSADGAGCAMVVTTGEAQP